MVPTGSSKKFGGAVDINIVNELKSPYTNDAIEDIKGWSNAVRNKKFISCYWNDDIGYGITPTNKVTYKGYQHQGDAIVLGNKVKPGELANSAKRAIEKSKS
ncbi:hypothetical protein GCM10010912_49390 [Paenibacillus albidus]|uniref:Uncharacterized protein n=1 Tax=Paenibacillus albidus TaxID=2041023 RepID=A0A917CUN8_9BACL|nr:hypothetical protein [Paenibacillus albidus]GGF98772.1 hypothetical protein GCM10010912_49390 [Paenibacillus albidus]